MNAVIVDTNVIVIANGEADHASLDCIKRCQQRLKQITLERVRTVVDNRWRILNEYKRNANIVRQKGIGDGFVKRLLQNWRYPDICTMIKITPLAGNGTDFEEFPIDDEILKDFHKNDRKFIAVALAYQRDTGQVPTILLAIDRGWLKFMSALASHGITVDLICVEEIQRPRQN